MKPALVSGVQPTGRLQIGNYLGALKNFVTLQQSGKYDCHFLVVDLHALTEYIPPATQRRNIIELAADFLAAGLDPKRSLIFQQSQVAAHSELAWIFNTLTPMGELSRMTQYKEKSDKHGANVGLFTYPALMAADIVLYDAKFVPVGEDQLQHIEFTRMITRRFNERFGRTFVEPKALLTETPRVMSLSDPARKMAKSDPAGCIFIDDEPADIMNKVKRAVTDSGSEVRFDPAEKPAVSNLLSIYAAVTGASIAKLEKQYKGVGYGAFKQDLATAIADHFADFRAKKKKLLKNPKQLVAMLKQGSDKARKQADTKMTAVRKRIGIAV